MPPPASRFARESAGRTGMAVRRAIILALPVAYVAGYAVHAGSGHALSWLCMTLGLCVAVFAGVRAGSMEASLQTGSVRDHLLTAGALGLALATAGLSHRVAWASLLGEVAALVASWLAIRAIFAIEADAGLAAEATVATAVRGFGLRDLERTALAGVAVAWGPPALMDALALTGWAPSMEAVAPVASATGGALGIFAVGGAAFIASGMRRLELESPPRILVCAAAATFGLLLAAALAFVTPIHADAATIVGATGAGFLTVRLARIGDAFLLARRGRRALTLTLFGGPLVVLTAVDAVSSSVGLVAFASATGALLVGMFAERLEEPFLPQKGVLRDALWAAQRKAIDRDPRSAIGHALTTLREASGRVPNADTKSHSPELWMLHPSRVHTVDAAGYLQERSAELPAALFEVARSEPHFTVRIDVLRALEVRRADLRPLRQWLEDRDALFATLIDGGDEPDGVLIVPAGLRGEPLTLEEVRAAKQLADSFVALCQTTSARERHLARERELQGRLDGLEDELGRLNHTLGLDTARNELASSRLARPASVGIYSAPSRLAYEALERRVERDAPVVLLAPAGVDPVPLLARAHLAGPRRRAPLVIVEGTSSREHDPERWKDPLASPLALADRGQLVLVDGAALPRDVQVLVARALAERRPPWERATPLDITVALTAVSPLARLIEEGRLTPELHARFDEVAAITVPGLGERHEDLFSIVADRLAREGLRTRGRPLGIDAAAFARLVDHPFEGEEAELSTIVTKLAKQVRSDVIRAPDIDAVLHAVPASPAEASEGTTPIIRRA